MTSEPTPRDYETLYNEAVRVIDTSVGLLRQLGGMLPGTREIVDTVVDLLTMVTEDEANA